MPQKVKVDLVGNTKKTSPTTFGNDTFDQVCFCSTTETGRQEHSIVIQSNF